MIGACGGVGSMVALGLAALSKRLIKATGLVTALPPFKVARLIGPGQIVVGGHEIRSQTLLSAVRTMHGDSNVLRLETISKCATLLRSMQRNIRPGITYGSTAHKTCA